MMEQTKYSVIIPVYQAEKTIVRCLDSLLTQPHDNVEVILVNDGSTDNSGTICRKYAEEYACVRYYEKENGGVSSARNYGIDRADGTYLLFVDSDDYVTSDYFEIIRSVLSKYDYDLVQFSHYNTDGIKLTEKARAPYQATTRQDLFPKLIELLYRKKSNGPVAKIYKNNIVKAKKIIFPEDMEVGEDRAFFIQYSFYISSLCISEKPIYIVNRENNGSLSRRFRDDLDAQTAVLNSTIKEKMLKSGLPDSEQTEYQKALNYDRMRMIYAKAKHLHRNREPFLPRIKTIRAWCKDLNQRNLSYPDSGYCFITSIPVRWNLPLVIDAMAWKMTR